MGGYDKNAGGPRPQAEAARRVAAFSRQADFLECTRRTCAASAADTELAWSARSPVELLRSAALHAPDLLVLDGQSVDSPPDVLLAEVHALAPATVSLLVAEPVESRVLHRALAFGLRGLVTPERLERDLLPAARIVMTGQFWFSRSLTAELLSSGVHAPPQDAADTWRHLPSLSARELAVLHEVLQGCSNKDIARTLAISEQTVKIHLQNVYRKLRVHRRIDLMLLHASVHG